jgi:hypothetical protein
VRTSSSGSRQAAAKKFAAVLSSYISCGSTSWAAVPFGNIPPQMPSYNAARASADGMVYNCCTALPPLCRVAQKHDLELPSQLVEGTIKGAPGAAAGLLEFLYEQLTGKK